MWHDKERSQVSNHGLNFASFTGNSIMTSSYKQVILEEDVKQHTTNNPQTIGEVAIVFIVS